MKRMLMATVLCASAVAVLVGAGAPAGKAKAKKAAVVWSAADMKWAEVPNVAGVKVAKLWGDMGKGAYGCITKFDSGLKHDLHTHSADLRTVVISGAFWYAAEGGPVKQLGPGSYLMIPGGVKHTSGCTDAGECMFFMLQAAKFDMMPVGAATPGK